jgi:YfiH family protein
MLEFSTILSKEPPISHFFSTRRGGASTGNYASLNLGAFCGDDPAVVAKNRKILCNTIGIDVDRLIVPRELHDNEIKEIEPSFFNLSKEEQLNFVSTCDALITNMREVCLAVSTADCVPILLYDKKLRIVAAVHAGWKGVVKKILPMTIELMQTKYNSNVEDIIAATGPCISVDLYQVNQDVVNEFQSVFGKDEMSHILQTKENGTLFIDLKKAVLIQCKKANLLDENVEIHSGCTFQTGELYFSARRDSVYSGRMLSGIFLR